MKKKHLVMVLSVFGVLLLIAAMVLTAIAFTRVANSSDSVGIIGGADTPSLAYVFFRANGGRHAILALLGVLTLAAALIVGLYKQKT